MNKKDKSRFEDLFSAARSRREEPTPESESNKPARKSKSTDPNYVRTTVYLPKRLHRKLKAAAAESEQEMSSIVEELLEAWLKSRDESSG